MIRHSITFRLVVIAIIGLTSCLKKDPMADFKPQELSPTKIDPSSLVVSMEDRICWHTGSDTTRHFVSYPELIGKVIDFKTGKEFPKIYVYPNLNDQERTRRFINSCDSLGLKKVRLALTGVTLEKMRDLRDSSKRRDNQ
jgi:hypothetical protein